MSKGRRSSLRSVGLNQPINELGTSRLLHNTGVSFAFCLHGIRVRSSVEWKSWTSTMNND